MALRHTFGSVTQITSSWWDDNYNDVWTGAIIPCSATGANAVALTPLVNTPTVSSYSNYQAYAWVQAAASSGSVTITVGTAPAINLYLQDGVTQAGNGNLSANVLYVGIYNSALNGGAGGIQLVSQLPISNALDLIGGTSTGTILYRGASAWASLAIGNSTQVLTVTGGVPAWGNSGSTKFQALTFASAGSFSFSSPSGIAASTIIKIVLTGGGAGGGGGGSADINGAQGAGAGATLIAYISGVSANTLYSGSIGMGANGGGASAGAGTAGSGGGLTTVSFGQTQFIANGGSGGRGSSQIANWGPNGGSSTTGKLNIPGGSGGPGPVTLISGGGQGGSSYWGPGAFTFPNLNNGAGGDANVYGAGGGGGSGGGGSSVSGGHGNTGVFTMEWVA